MDNNELKFIARENLLEGFIKSVDISKEMGIKLPEDILQNQARWKQLHAIKKRDRLEPDRLNKHLTEVHITRVVLRALRKQAQNVMQQLEMQFPGRKATIAPPIELIDWEDSDISELIRTLTQAAKNGILLFGTGKPIIDYSLTNVEAAKWARNYAYDLIKNINKVTQQAISQAIRQFVETPGLTLRDVMNLLPFDEVRATRIAVTETTRAYAEGQQMAGEALKEEFPDVQVVKTWFTNNDDLVCDICGPLDGMEVDIDESFDGEIDNPPAHVNCRCWTDSTTRI